MILVGNPDSARFGADDWERLFECIRQGARAVFLNHAALFPQDGSAGRLPFVQKGKAVRYVNTLYHKEDVARNHPVFDGLQAGGIMDWDYYDQVIPDYVLEEMEQPDEVMAAGFAVGYPCPGGYYGGIEMAGYSYGRGGFIVTTLRILEHLDDNPAADRLLLNLCFSWRQAANKRTSSSWHSHGHAIE